MQEALKHLVQQLKIPLVIYTKAKQGWASVLIAAMETVVGFQFLIDDGLFHSDDCERRGTGHDIHPKLLKHVVDKIRRRGAHAHCLSAAVGIVAVVAADCDCNWLVV